MENLQKPRREFLREAVLLSASFLLPWLEACQSNSDPSIATPDFLSQIQEAKAIRAIGEAYIKIHPEEASPTTLSALLMGQQKGKADPTSITKNLREKISNDFQSGAVVVIKGWVLSITEARQCALFYLSFNS
jgi:hypothetical protein